MPAVVIPRILREKMGDEASEALVDLINQVTDQSRQETIIFVEEKFERRLAEEFARLRSEDLVQLREEIISIKAELREEMAQGHAQLREEMAQGQAQLREEMAQGHAQLRVQMADYRADLIRWMFIFWVGQLGAILAIIFVFFG